MRTLLAVTLACPCIAGASRRGDWVPRHPPPQHSAPLHFDIPMDTEVMRASTRSGHSVRQFLLPLAAR
jgi:hypothetical protein